MKTLRTAFALAILVNFVLREGPGRSRFFWLHEFYMTMLGKNEWWLIQHRESLVSRLYQARYFHSSYFLYARRGPNPSFI